MILKLDENMPGAALRLLRENGHDAMSVLDQKMGGYEDAELIEAARAENRAFITLDLHFSDIRAYPPSHFSGIIVLRPARQDAQRVCSLLRGLKPVLEREPLAGRLWIVDERQVRIRGGK